ncbi:Nucleoside-diphosphate-sugar pyrophosphorylase family protein [Caldisphaera lagunensis DSM 15908]|uniref:Nucleoside-diphosphate-sugar pyrophosphorylase family protein n=1 Tax=Caldisphaera lagunensis (strain DSM 15908 / JCM 11604 / ANMR 0165 / IC-154) TaxID=1056495 RepID=L0ABQ2_CALLD|nr:nucleotidyltransferase family protein [Caldisphaera lagunensis]AFZ70557.1 Nucleoside-diphosphate-sugar pyrophosphorylase family protein [Caldisphaera lagunensis DSM 15908]
MDLTAVIPAGGEGSRFKPYTDIVPKPMIPLGEEEKPILDYIVHHLSRNGFEHIILLVNYKWKYIKNYFQDGNRYNLKIDYSIDDDKYSNTGGSLLKAYKNNLINSDPVLIWYGDILANLNPNDIVKVHKEEDLDALLVVADKYQIPVGVAEIDENNNIVRLREKPWYEIKVTIGILTLNVDVLKSIENALGTKFDIMGDLIPYMIKNKKKVKAYIYNEEWIDVGSLERYKKIDEKILKKVIR